MGAGTGARTARRGLRRRRLRRRRARGHGRDRDGAGRARLALARRPVDADPRRRPPRAGRCRALPGPAVPLADPPPRPAVDGWYRYDIDYWRRDHRGFLEFFFAKVFTEPHSTKPIEDCVGWGLEMTPETLIASELGAGLDE